MEMPTQATLPTPIKIQPEEYVHTPSSSVTASPAESCSSDVVKQRKPWKRTASNASSVNTSEASEPIWEEDTVEDHSSAEEEEPDRPVVAESNAKTSAEALKMQTHLRGMQRRLKGLQRVVQEAAQQGRFRSLSLDAPGGRRSCLFAMEETDAVADQSIDLRRRRSSAQNDRAQQSSKLASEPPSSCVEDTPNDEANDSRDDQQDSSSSSSGGDDPPAITALLNQIKNLQTQLKVATDENLQLQNTVNRLEEENARLQSQTARNPPEGALSGRMSTKSTQNQESSTVEGDEVGDESISHLTTAIFGEPSAFQMAMQEDLATLKDHERCQHKLHELWDTIRTLRTFVETYELERNTMKSQRDEAIAEAERADAENVKLASSSNQQQKIKYLQQVKKDNQELRRKNRALNVRIAKQAAKIIREKNGCSLLGDSSLSFDTIESDSLDDTLLECDEPSVRAGEEILRSMWDHSGVLQQRLERLRQARKDLPEDDDDLSELQKNSAVKST